MKENWSVRTESLRDQQAVRSLLQQAFTTNLEADLVDALRSDPAWLPEYSVVVENDGGQIIGHALLTRCHIDDHPALLLAPVSVLPHYQRRGVGGAAITHVLEVARGAGEGSVVLIGHAAYYPRFGFVRASTLGVRFFFDVPDDSAMVKPLDNRIPVPTGTIRMASPFGRH